MIFRIFFNRLYRNIFRMVQVYVNAEAPLKYKSQTS
jgi:hypothetical protein